MSETREALNDLETRMDGFGGRNWRDEYPGYEQLDIVEKIETLMAAITEYED
jgi:hypothetical protein